MEAKKKKEEEERQKALTKPKPLLPTPQTIPSSIPSKPAFPTSQPNFSASQSIPCSIPVAKSVETKPLFGDKTQSSFGFFAEKSAPKVDSTTPSPFSVAATIASSGASMFSSKPFGSSSPSTGFQFATASTDSGVNSQNKPIDISAASKPIGMAAPAPEKPKPVLSATPPNFIKKDAVPISLASNIAPQKTPLLATPPQPPSLLSNLQPSAASATSFKFDIENTLSSAIDKTRNDKENIPIVSSVPITKTNSPSSFSFGGTNISTAPLKPNIPTVSAGLAATTITPVSVPATTPFAAPAPAPTSTLPSSTKSSATDFSFAKPSGQTSIFGGSSAAATTTNVSTANSNATVSSTTDPSSVFQNFNICKPNVADNSSCKFFFDHYDELEPFEGYNFLIFHLIYLIAGKGLFSTNSFGSLSANATSPTNAATIFGSSAANIAQSTSAQTSIFGGQSVTTR